MKRALEGKVVVVTGAGSGIGRATALRFAREGARLHLVDIDAARVVAVRREVEEVGAFAAAHVVDCADADAVADMAREVCDAEPRVDVLYNNAGVSSGGPMEALSLEAWHRTMDINVWGVIHGIRAFLPQMIEQGGGHIVNTASMAGLVGLPMVTPYCTSKFAVVGLSESLDIELGVYGIRVTAVCPGAVRTNVMRDGRFDLPGGLAGRIVEGVDRIGADPDWVALQVVAAVKRDRGMVIIGREMMPLWLIRRLSLGAYRAMARVATRWIRARWPEHLHTPGARPAVTGRSSSGLRRPAA